MYATAEQLRRHGYGEDVVARALDLRRRFEDSVHDRPVDEEALASELLAALDEEWYAHLWLPPTLLDDEGKRLWIEEMDFDPRPIFARVRVPTLAFYGQDDGWSPVEPSVEAWRAAHADDVEIVVIPEASHELRLPDGRLAPEYERKLVEWVVRRPSG
jgi:pimeloyl-ACP methyl ester carboxylesterase